MSELGNKRLLYVAILLGLLAFVFNFAYIKSIELEASGGVHEYVIAKVRIRSGNPVSDDHLQTLSVTDKVNTLINSRYLTFRRFQQAEAKIAQRDILPGEFISKDAIGVSAFDFNPASLGEHERLIFVPVDEESSIGYRLHPGDRIDIYSLTGSQVRLVLSNVEVAVVGTERARSGGSGRPGYRSIGLRVTTSDAEKILAARSRSGQQFEITLRSPSN